MQHAFSRTELLLGKEAIKTLKNSRVAIFGIGGVGTFAVEGLVRSGVGKFLLIDDDLICLTNLNRQIHATRKTIGKAKVEVMKERILEINPKAQVDVYNRFYLAERKEGAKKAPAVLEEEALTWKEVYAYHQTPGQRIDYIIDGVDTVSAKLELVVKATEVGIPIISSMGAGNKLDPAAFEVADIYKTSVCPLARVMRRELKKRQVKGLKVVYSKELPLTPMVTEEIDCNSNCVCPSGSTRTCTSRRSIPGSVSFVPSVAGLILAGEVIKDLIREEVPQRR